MRRFFITVIGTVVGIFAFFICLFILLMGTGHDFRHYGLI